MKAITLYQPHATLMAIGAKRIETRPKSWKHRGPVAVHAGLDRRWMRFCREEPFRSVLRAAEYDHNNLPFGCVIAVVNMVGCWRSEQFGDECPFCSHPGQPDNPLVSASPCLCISEQERAFGNYARGRFGYLTDAVVAITNPIPATGHQGMWDWEPPQEAATAIARLTVGGDHLNA